MGKVGKRMEMGDLGLDLSSGVVTTYLVEVVMH